MVEARRHALLVLIALLCLPSRQCQVEMFLFFQITPMDAFHPVWSPLQYLVRGCVTAVELFQSTKIFARLRRSSRVKRYRKVRYGKDKTVF